MDIDGAIKKSKKILEKNGNIYFNITLYDKEINL